MKSCIWPEERCGGKEGRAALSVLLGTEDGSGAEGHGRKGRESDRKCEYGAM